MQPSITTLQRLIGASIEASRVDIAQGYISTAVREGYDVGMFVFALHLIQGHTIEALEQFIRLLPSHGAGDMSQLEDYSPLLMSTIRDILLDPTDSRDMDHLKILASYINLEMTLDTAEPDPRQCIIHMNYILSVVNCYN
jgi:hypothetical protein